MYWRNPSWVYHGSDTHGDLALFVRRQRRRMKEEQARAKAAIARKRGHKVVPQ